MSSNFACRIIVAVAGPTPFNSDSVFTAVNIEGIVVGLGSSENAFSVVDVTSAAGLLEINCFNRGRNLPRDLYQYEDNKSEIQFAVH